MLADQLVRLRDRLVRHAVSDLLAALEHERVRAERLAFDDGEQDGALLAVDDLEQAVRDAHSSGSTKTSISPPQGRPTSHASSSPMPYERSLGFPVSSTSRAFS